MQLTTEENRLVREGLTQLADRYEQLAKGAEKVADDHMMAAANDTKNKVLALRGWIAHQLSTPASPKKEKKSRK